MANNDVKLFSLSLSVITVRRCLTHLKTAQCPLARTGHLAAVWSTGHTHIDSCAHCRDEAEEAGYEAAESSKDKCDNEASDQSIQGQLGVWWRLVVHHHVGGLGHHLRMTGHEEWMKGGVDVGRRGCGGMNKSEGRIKKLVFQHREWKRHKAAWVKAALPSSVVAYKDT